MLSTRPPTRATGGEFLVGVAPGGCLVATGAVRDVTDKVAELERIHVHPSFQRRGFARQTSTRLEDRAPRSSDIANNRGSNLTVTRKKRRSADNSHSPDTVRSAAGSSPAPRLCTSAMFADVPPAVAPRSGRRDGPTPRPSPPSARRARLRARHSRARHAGRTVPASVRPVRDLSRLHPSERQLGQDRDPRKDQARCHTQVLLRQP